MDHMPLTLGYKASAEQFDPRELVEIAVAAEAHGMESVAVSDHFQPWRHEGGHAPFSLTWMAAVGERTSSIRIGTSVMTPTFRYNPAVIAQAFATMGVLYPGRIFLGVGTGEALNEIATGFRGAGEQDWPEFKERFARLREAVDLMRTLWRDDRVNFEGEYYSTHDASIYDRPDTPIPVYVAAGGPVVARYAGRAGDGFICTSGKGMELYTEQLIPAVKEGAEQAEPQLRRHRPHDRDQGQLRHRPRHSVAEHPLLGAARAQQGAEARHHRPCGDGEGRRRPADRADRLAAGSSAPIPTRSSPTSSSTSTPASPTSSSTRPGADQRRFLELFEKDLAPRLRAL